MVYDVTNKESFANLEDWLSKIKKHSKAKPLLYLVGNKIDLIGLQQVTVTQHESFMEENELNGGMFVSAKTGENVLKTFYQVSGDLIGIKLSSSELEYHNKVLKAYIPMGNQDEGRTAWAGLC